ncbi:unnamed protein product [Acanthoscelides obtectus]|uniref:Uncharacterized protein n=1 Tax=Acanthoscelides obtectus TaxID=200917 RepID=A0A9P0Q779_ACAOB|nr:unnamed protein product [Acanthoscelides obtectus]CAK1676005.1 hypothetical protein AOBTE_LOCUS30543 [Acanthoscelides obtectus]
MPKKKRGNNWCSKKRVWYAKKPAIMNLAAISTNNYNLLVEGKNDSLQDTRMIESSNVDQVQPGTINTPGQGQESDITVKQNKFKRRRKKSNLRRRKKHGRVLKASLPAPQQQMVAYMGTSILNIPVQSTTKITPSQVQESDNTVNQKKRKRRRHKTNLTLYRPKKHTIVIKASSPAPKQQMVVHKSTEILNIPVKSTTNVKDAERDGINQERTENQLVVKVKSEKPDTDPYVDNIKFENMQTLMLNEEFHIKSEYDEDAGFYSMQESQKLEEKPLMSSRKFENLDASGLPKEFYVKAESDQCDWTAHTVDQMKMELHESKKLEVKPLMSIRKFEDMDALGLHKEFDIKAESDQVVGHDWAETD